jgi:hypothetical protein
MREFNSVSDALEQYVAPFEGDDGDWEEILRRADADPPRRRLRFGAAGGAAVAAIVAVVLFWPFAGDKPGVLDRALAAVGDGPVLHVVFEEDWGGTVVDLRTGERRELHGEREAWYDRERGLHTVSLLGGSVQSDELLGPDGVPQHEAKTFGLLGEGYREALRSGRASNLGAGEAYGEAVYWIRVDAQWLPDSADGKLHEWAHDVAVSRSTFEPVATRETRDGKPGPDTGARILRLETLAAGDGDFSVGARPITSGTAFKEGSEQIARERAADALGRTPLWLGPGHADIPLAQVLRTTKAKGDHRRTELTGTAAANVRACFKSAPRTGRRSKACESMRTLRGSVLMHGGKVYALGPVEWGEAHTGVRLFYGTVGSDPSTQSVDVPPVHEPSRLDHPYIELTETTHRNDLRGSFGYVPPEGSVLLLGGRLGLLAIDGVYIGIAASSEDLLLSAARALEPMP